MSYDGHQSTSKVTEVSEGTIQVTPFSYDQIATLEIERVTAEGWDLPESPSIPVTLFNTSMPPNGTKELGGGTNTAPNLWPYPDGYSGWAGTCATNDPAAAGASRSAPVVVEPGGTETLQVPLTPVTVTEVDDAGNAQSGRTVLAMAIDSATGDMLCGPYTLGTTDAAGVLKTSLPAGAWLIRDDDDPMCFNRPVEEPCLGTPPLTGALTEVSLTLVREAD